MPAPLDGLRVIEFASVLAGPAAGQFLAELGADVIKIENPGGDVTRTWKVPDEDPADDRSAYFAAVNWGKRSMELDLGRPENQERLHDMVGEADVVLTSFKPGDAERLGADALTLRAINPRLIVARTVGYGADDPRPGYDAVIQAEAGFMSINGETDGPPMKLPVALIDVLAAAQLKEAILLALLRRERTGEGATITVSLFDAAVAALANQASNFLTTGHAPVRAGSDHPNIAPYGTPFRTADGHWLVLAVGTDRQFQDLCAVLGLDHLATAPTFATNQKRVRNRPFLHNLLEERIAAMGREELLGELHARGIPAGSVRSLDEVFEQPAADDLVLREEASGLAGVRTVVFDLDGEDRIDLAAPPHLGDDAIRPAEASPSAEAVGEPA